MDVQILEQSIQLTLTPIEANILKSITQTSSVGETMDVYLFKSDIYFSLPNDKKLKDMRQNYISSINK